MKSVSKYRMRLGCRRSGGKGFTILECLVVIAIIGVLVALALPSLRSTRQRALVLGDEAHARQLLTGVQNYCGMYRDLFPTAGKTFGVQSGMWISAMAAAGFGSIETAVSSTGMPYKMTYAAFVSPSEMELDRVRHAEDVKPSTQRMSDVRYPSAKGLLWPVSRRGGDETLVWCCTNRAILGAIPFADGSVVTSTWAAMVPDEGLTIQYWVGYPVLSTWNGMHGRDRR